MKDKVVVITGGSGGIGAALAAPIPRPQMRELAARYFAADDVAIETRLAWS